jgi:hypothetical protein
MKRWPWSFEGVDAVEEGPVEVNVQVERGAGTLDQGHCTGLRAGGNGESALKRRGFLIGELMGDARGVAAG